MYLHVFPKLSAAATSAAPAAAAASTASKSTHEDQIINCNMKDFEDILRRHCTTWLQRRRCLQVLESFNSKLQSIEDKMVINFCFGHHLSQSSHLQGFVASRECVPACLLTSMLCTFAVLEPVSISAREGVVRRDRPRPCPGQNEGGTGRNENFGPSPEHRCGCQGLPH